MPLSLKQFNVLQKSKIKPYLKEQKVTLDDCLNYIDKHINDKFTWKLSYVEKYITENLIKDKSSIIEYFKHPTVEKNSKNSLIKKLNQQIIMKYLDKFQTGYAILTAVIDIASKIPKSMCENFKDYVDKNSDRFTFYDCEQILKSYYDNSSKASDPNLGGIYSIIYKCLIKCINKLNFDYRKYIIDFKDSQDKYKKDIAKLIMDSLPLDKLKEYAPLECQDPSDKYLNSKQHNTGVYLWKIGYKIKKCLGAGGFGVVWETTDGKAVKVLCGSNKDITAETINVSKMQKLFKDYPDAKNYILENSTSMKYSNIVDSVLGKKDMANNLIAQSTKKRDPSKGNKTIASFLRKAIQGISSVKILHDQGWSHNDIKLDNFFKIKDIHVGSDGKNHKSRMLLGDVGSMTRLNNYYGATKYTESYIPDDIHDIFGSEEAVAKRDVYALGATLLLLLFRGKYPLIKNIINVVHQFDLSRCYDGTKLNEMYPGTSKDNVIKVLELLRDMTEQEHRNRITIDQAYNRITKIKAD